MIKEDVIEQLSRLARIQSKWDDLFEEVSLIATGSTDPDGAALTEIYKTAYTNVFGSLPDGIDA